MCTCGVPLLFFVWCTVMIRLSLCFGMCSCFLNSYMCIYETYMYLYTYKSTYVYVYIHVCTHSYEHKWCARSLLCKHTFITITLSRALTAPRPLTSPLWHTPFLSCRQGHALVIRSPSFAWWTTRTHHCWCSTTRVQHTISTNPKISVNGISTAESIHKVCVHQKNTLAIQ